MADNTAAISELDDVIRAGANSVEVDGQKVAFDLDAMRRERNDLIQTDTTRAVDRPRVSTVKLNGWVP